MRINKIYLSAILLLVIPMINDGCKNKYEKALIGHYELYAFEISDSNALDTIKQLSIRLELKPDMTFILTNKNLNTIGTWEADEIREITGITFHFKNNLNGIIRSDGTFSGTDYSIINIWNPKDFYCPSLRKLSFKRTGG